MKEYDTVVIGGGPAGLSAAIRLRWVKTEQSIPMDVCVINSGPIGGLASWEDVNITGPSWKTNAQPMLEDIKSLDIPVVNEKVVEVSNEGEAFIVKTDKNEYKTLSIVIATGLKPLCNEHEFLGKGVMTISKGYHYVIKKYKEFLASNKDKKIVVLGTKKVSNIKPLFDEFNNGNEITYSTNSDVVEFLGGDRLEKIRFESGEEIDCDFAIIDFNSHELSNTCADFINVNKNERGFILVDRDMKTNIEGVFAAGDITGNISSFSKAVGEGVVAGFSAYRHVFNKKFGREPDLFAFIARDFKLK